VIILHESDYSLLEALLSSVISARLCISHLDMIMSVIYNTTILVESVSDNNVLHELRLWGIAI
jgi:hypothetical protein